jgi:hypothetical protein
MTYSKNFQWKTPAAIESRRKAGHTQSSHMSDTFDLQSLLASWPYDPENDTRLVRGRDGREILQVRTSLGVEQYELEGRPDGARPHGMESALEFYRVRLERLKGTAREGSFKLNAKQCSEIFDESTLYYLRYVRLFQLKDWPRTIRDTARNLQAFDFVHRHAEREEDQLFLEKWRPYILRVNASANAMHFLEKHAYDQALGCLRKGMSTIEALPEFEDETFHFERERSLLALRELLSQVEKNRPMTQLEQLEHQLKRAIERQEFERAAVLRDRIRLLRNPPRVC